MSDPNEPTMLPPPTSRSSELTKSCIARMKKLRDAEERRFATTGFPQSANPHRFGDNYEIETEFRGETIHYIENGRRVSMQFFWTKGYLIVWDSIREWSNADGTTSPVSDEERAEIVHRVVKYAREVQHVVMLVEK
jgi:hypothetical protein